MTKFKSSESYWHRKWKEYYRDCHDADLEVRIGSHMCDVLLPDGQIVEIQRKPLPYQQIIDREYEYQDRLQWLYCADFFLNRITGLSKEAFHPYGEMYGEYRLPVNQRFRFSGKLSSIVYHKQPVWIEFRNYFYRLYTWCYEDTFYGKFKQEIYAYEKYL